MFKIYLFSPVKGVVLDKGVPVEGALIERSWVRGDTKECDATKTNGQGEFSLPEIRRSSILAHVLPHEPVIRQDILIKYKDKTYEAWLSMRHTYELNAEFDGAVFDVVCELTREPRSVKLKLTRYYGIAEQKYLIKTE